jgi:outer membrane protein, multidrug efflux system
LARLRYDSGYPSYLEVLDASRQLFAAELVLSQAQRDSLVSVVQLYKALGGGRCA